MEASEFGEFAARPHVVDSTGPPHPRPNLLKFPVDTIMTMWFNVTHEDTQHTLRVTCESRIERRAFGLQFSFSGRHAPNLLPRETFPAPIAYQHPAIRRSAETLHSSATPSIGTPFPFVTSVPFCGG